MTELSTEPRPGLVRVDERHGGGALCLTLQGREGNVLDAAMIAALRDALATRVRPSHRAIVFAGAGRHFSFGASVAEHDRAHAPAMLESFHALFRQLAALSVPTVALVHGQCLGGGLELASWCTWVLAAPDARLGQPEITLGVFPPLASLLLPWRIGGGAAMHLCVGGASVDAQTAKSMGLVHAVGEDPSALFDELYATQLAPRSASSLRFAERAARAELYAQLSTRLPRLESLYLEELMATHDANEGIAAFLERRKPEFRHT